MVDAVRTILGKKEATYSVDAAPTPALNAALTRNFSTTPLEVDQLDRNLDLPSRGRSKSAPTNRRKRYGFELEMAGSGAAGTAPAWMEYIEACGGRVPTLVANTSAAQTFVGPTDPISSMTFYDWTSTEKRIGIGARGTFDWDWTAGAYPSLKFDFTALVPVAGLGMSTAAPGAPSFARWIDAVEVGTINSLFVLDGYAAKLRSFTGTVAADVKIRNLVGANYVQRGNHAITGNIVIEAVEIAGKNYFSRLAVGDEVVVQAINGTVPGNIVQLDSSHVQILSIAESVEDGKVMHTIGYGMNVGTGSDDLILTAK